MAEIPNDKESVRRRTEVQVRLILDALDGVGVDPPDWERTGEVDHLYRQGTVLVRDEDLPRVREVLPGEVRDGRVRGFSAYGPAAPVPEALAIVDRELGAGVATPDHVLYVTTKTFCPATEPELPEPAEPDPPVQDDDCTGAGVLVSVVDTGWLPEAAVQHDWLRGVAGDVEAPFDARTGTIRPYAGHGTFAAGVVRTMAPAAEVYVDGILPAAGAWFESDIVAQLGEALRRAPDVVSLQAGTTTRKDLPLLAFEVLHRTLLRDLHGTVVVAAAGNDGSRRRFWPAAFPWITAVGGLTRDGSARASWSNFGPWVDVWARGEDLVNAYVKGTFIAVEPPHAGEPRAFDAALARWSGTSFATPYVAGCIAARMSARHVSAPRALAGLMRRAKRTAVPGAGPVVTRGMACPPQRGTTDVADTDGEA